MKLGSVLTFLLFSLPVPVLCQPTVTLSGDPSAKQAAFYITGLTTPSQSTCTVYLDAALTVKSYDTNESVFTGSESCARSTSVIDSMSSLYYVAGLATSQPVTSSSGAVAPINWLVSRALQSFTPHWLKVTNTATSQSTVLAFTTNTIYPGDTKTMDAPVVPDGTGRLAWPDLDFSDAGLAKFYIDPETGVGFHRVAPGNQMSHNMNDIVGASSLNFPTVIDETSAWTNKNNSYLNPNTTGPYATCTGSCASSQAPLFFPFPADGISKLGSRLTIYWGAPYIDDIRINIYGTCTSTGTAADCDVLVCLDPYHIAGQCRSPELPVSLSTSGNGSGFAPSSFPLYYFNGWGFTKPPSAEEAGVPWGGSAIVNNSIVTINDSGDSYLLPTGAKTGNKIQIGGVYYTIGTIRNAKDFSLQETGINVVQTSWAMGGFGARIRKRTATTNQIQVSANFQVAYGEGANQSQPVNGSPRTCSPLSFPVLYAADGVTLLSKPKTGRLCMVGGPGQYIALLTNDGETRYLSNLTHLDTTGNGAAFNIPDNSFSLTDPYSLIALHVDDSYGYIFNTSDQAIKDKISKGYRSFYQVKYDTSHVPTSGGFPACRFQAYPGKGYKTTNPDDCFSWINLTPGLNHPGGTVTEKILAFTATYPFWNNGADLSALNFGFTMNVDGRYADLTQWPDVSGGGNDRPVVHAEFSLSPPYDLVMLYDTISGGGTRVRWTCPHNLGYMTGFVRADGSAFGADLSSRCAAKNGTGYGQGPFRLQSVSAVSFDTGQTWDTNTSINPGTLIPIGSCGTKCGTPPAWVVGSQAVDLTRAAGPCPANNYGVATGSLECVAIKIPSDQPCNMHPSTAERNTWGPCPWSQLQPWTPTLNQKIVEGDHLFRATNLFDANDYPTDLGKNESMRIILKVADGSTGGWILHLQRWTGADNQTSDASKGAICDQAHLCEGQLGNSYNNGWNAGADATPVTWTEIKNPASQARSFKDTTFSSGHSAFGISQKGDDLATVSGGLTHIGLDLNTNYYFNNINDSVFYGRTITASSNYLEQYPGCNNFYALTEQERAMCGDWRHVNPGFGSSYEHMNVMWPHTYQKVTGQNFTYKIGNILNDQSNHKSHRPSVFSTKFGFTDISGPGSTIDDTKPFTYCYVYRAGECVSGSLVGELYASAPIADWGDGGCISNTYRYYSVCAAVTGYQWGFFVQGNMQKDDARGLEIRRITRGMTNTTGQYEFTAPHFTPSGDQALVKPGWPNFVRPDYLVFQMPPLPARGSIDRSTYVPISVVLPTGSGYIRGRFGYQENGTWSNYYCTSRKEGCVTDATVAPFAYTSAFPSTSGPTDTLTATNCTSGCTLAIPGLSGRALYYRLEYSNNGTSNWVAGVTKVQMVP